MRKWIAMLCCVLLVILTAAPALGAPAAPEFTLQPQSPDYPEYSTAIYTVKVSGSNLRAVWYLQWEGETYNLSDMTNGFEPWEGYAGETYGPVQNDGNTFSCFFGGIGAELNGAEIWCVVEDGHYEVTSRRARICVGNPNTPPEIISMPVELTVEQGDEAELRCIAKSPDGSQLSFLWYETDTGRLEDMRAVNRGTETTDYIFCDTTAVGTRNYLCMVTTTEGGAAYSSIVPVTVTEKTQPPAVTTAPTEPVPETTEPTQPPTEAATEPPTETTVPTEPATEPIPETTAPTQAVTEPVPETTAPARLPAEPDPVEPGVSWPVVGLIALGSAAAGVAVAVVLVRRSRKPE